MRQGPISLDEFLGVAGDTDWEFVVSLEDAVRLGVGEVMARTPAFRRSLGDTPSVDLCRPSASLPRFVIHTHARICKRCVCGGQLQRGGRPKTWLNTASYGNSRKNRCHRRFLMRRNQMSSSLADPAPDLHPNPSSLRPNLASTSCWAYHSACAAKSGHDGSSTNTVRAPALLKDRAGCLNGA